MGYPKTFLLVVFSVAALLSGCGVAKHASGPVHTGRSGSSSVHQSPAMMGVTSISKTQASLRQAYHEWKGTPYRWGGATLEGIDCSMFVNTVFEDYFNIELPRRTRAQLNAGRSLRRSAIRSGDLVFFRTGRKTLHVGIMMNQTEFLHASTTQGVTISRMDENYWSKRYLAGRRVI